jgi:maltooligosyltrehalose trehalohydrolase
MSTLPIGELGARETAPGVIDISVLLPWVRPEQGDSVTVKVIHEHDQFLKQVPARLFLLQHETHPVWGDKWSVRLHITPDSGGSAWGQPGRYIYRYAVTNPRVGEVDFVGDPFAREFGVGRMSAFTLGFRARGWAASESAWRTPRVRDLIMYEMMISEFAADIDEAAERLGYLADLGINCLSLMPLSNVAPTVDWGYLPIGYFGVDERFGRTRPQLQQFVERAHQLGIAVIVDAVYGHTSELFPYAQLYRRLGYEQNPFLGHFAKDYFGESTDFGRDFTRAFYQTVNQYWLDRYHLDGFRYDCVPNYWDGPTGKGYAALVYETYRFTEDQRSSGGAWSRFFDADSPNEVRLIQCAEQLEDPRGILTSSYSNCTWQNDTLDAATRIAHGDRKALYDLGMRLGGDGYPRSVAHSSPHQGDVAIEKRPLQYIENHDHERFVCQFGLSNGQHGLLQEGNRSQWFRVQPYLMGLLLGFGVPLLWQGEELAENYWVPPDGLGRVMLLRPVRWDYFYDDTGRGMLSLVRRLVALRRDREEFRAGEYFFHNDWDKYQSRGVLLFSRSTEEDFSLVALNFSDTEQWVPFTFPRGGSFVEELHRQPGDAFSAHAGDQRGLFLPSNYGRVWSTEHVARVVPRLRPVARVAALSSNGAQLAGTLL